jgi:translation initiation factor 3 subunit F
LNTYSALIQNFYSQETAPHPAIHIALNTGTESGEEAGVKAYIRLIPFAVALDIQPLSLRSSPVGVFPKPENAVFVPIPIALRANDAERSGRAYFSCSGTSYPYNPNRFRWSYNVQCICWKIPLRHPSESLPNLRAR